MKLLMDISALANFRAAEVSCNYSSAWLRRRLGKFTFTVSPCIDVHCYIWALRNWTMVANAEESRKVFIFMFKFEEKLDDAKEVLVEK